nr:cytochrome c family protein [Beijerinckia indica]
MKTVSFSLAAFLSLAGATAVLAAGDPEAGEKIFTTKCKVCHQIGPGAKNFVGPELNGLIGRKAGTSEGYTYSDAMKNSGLTWDEATFKDYIKNPKAKLPGIKMIFAGLPKESDQDNLTAYLATFDATGAKK